MRLSNQNIDNSIAKIEKFFESLDVSKKDKIKICLLLEESLLRYQEKFGEDCQFKLTKRKWLGTPKILVKIKCTPYNPLEDYDENQIFSEDIMQNLLNYESTRVVYRYERGYNEIIAFASKKYKKLKIPGGLNTIAIFFAIIFALITEDFSDSTQNFISKDIVTPILDTLLGTVIAINIPLIFISIVTSICGIENVSTLNNLGTKILKRFAGLIIFTLIITMPICLIFFPVLNFNFDGKILADGGEEMKQLFNLFLSIVPQNIIDPFAEEKILQIVVLALITGICVTILGERVSGFKNLMFELKEIIFEVANIIMKVIPLVIFLCIFKTILEYSFAEIFSFWKIVATEYLAFLIISFVMLLKNLIKHDVKILDFLKKIYPAFLISFTTGSGSAAMPKNIEVCKKKLKIQGELCDFYIPLSHALCPVTTLVGILSCTFFAAEFSGIQISIAQLFIVAFLSIQFAISSTGGNGGMIAIMSLLLTQLGISLDAIGIITATDIFVVNISGIIALIVRDCDLLDFSRKMKL